MAVAVKNRTLKREQASKLASSWDYNGSPGKGHKVSYNITCDAYNVKTKKPKTWVHCKSAGYEDTGGKKGAASNVRSFSANFPTASKYYPNTDWRVTRAHALASLGGDGAAAFDFYEPVPPTIELSRNDLVLTWKVSVDGSKMSATSHYYCTQTWYYLQTVTQGQKWGNLERYKMPTKTGQFTGTSGSYSKTFTSYTPAKPTAFRLCAVNVGPSGMSTVKNGPAHVFAQVNMPTISKKGISYGATSFTVNANDDWWHPVDHIILQRQQGTAMSPNGQWDDVADIEGGAGEAKLMRDDTEAQIPGEDEATFWRVVTWHDDVNLNQQQAYPTGQPFRAGTPKKPTIGSCTSAAGIVTATWTIESDCSPKHVCRLKVKETASSSWQKLEEKTLAAGVTTCTFTKSVSAYAMWACDVRAMKEWGGDASYAGTKYSEWSSSQASSMPVIESVTLLEDGTSVLVEETHPDDDADTTEYSWHTRADGWTCSVDPSTKEMPSTGTESHITIADLEEGVEYYIQARRHDSVNDTYGPYSSQVSISSGGTPGTPTLMADGEVAAGRDIEFQWTFGGGTQKQAVLSVVKNLMRTENFTGNGSNRAFTLSETPSSTPTVTVDGTATSAFTSSGATVTMTSAPASGALVSVTFSAESGVESVLVDGADQAYVYSTGEDWEGTVSATVSVTTGGKWSAESDAVSTTVEQPPVCTAEAAGTLSADATAFGGYVLTALPLSLALGGGGDRWDVSVRCVGGSILPRPSGDVSVGDNTVVARLSTAVSGTVEIVDTPFVLVGGAAYEATVKSTDTGTGAVSEPVVVGFTVQWATEAVEPEGTVEITPDGAAVTVSQGTGAGANDTLNLWRMTADGADLVYPDCESGSTYTDRVPPYGWAGCAYVVESVTPDGDPAITEIPYSLPTPGVTVTFGEEDVVLPWNLDYSDSYGNLFESRSHMDGTRVGYWERGVDRTARTSGDLRKGLDEGVVLALRRLGRHSGICYVRAGEGVAFPAHVDVELSRPYNDGRVSASLSMTEVTDDGSFRALEADEIVEDEEEEED